MNTSILVTCELARGLAPRYLPMLDSILAWVLERRARLAPRSPSARVPIAEERGIRLVSAGLREEPVIVPAGAPSRPRMVRGTRGERVQWYAFGDADAVRALLADALHLSRRRVYAWTVDPCTPWEGFPVLHRGVPLRALPGDWPGLSPTAPRGYAVLTPPYHQIARAERCAVPHGVNALTRDEQHPRRPRDA